MFFDMNDMFFFIDNIILHDPICDQKSPLNPKIKKIIDQDAPIDAFCVGTELATSKDDPTLSGVYKLIEYNKKPRIKLSENKISYPSQKQIFRIFNDKGKFKEDILALVDEDPPKKSNPLLIPIMKKGNLIYDLPRLVDIQKYCLANIEKLPDKYKQIDKIQVSKLRISEGLRELTNSLIKKYK